MQKNSSTYIKINNTPIKIKNASIENNQYSLKQNFFDPTKSSPPNIFMIKLYNRMTQFESNHKNESIFDNK
jgi:hypothetical protein